MILGPVFERFLDESPLSVMMRATLEHAFSASALDDLFEQHADYQQIRQRLPASLNSVYEKLAHLETPVCAALVRHVARRCQGLLSHLGGARKPLLPGYRVRLLDGNHLAATHKRLKATQGRSAAPLPGQALAVLDPAPDAHHRSGPV
jgi:hypothetical protein